MSGASGWNPADANASAALSGTVNSILNSSITTATGARGTKSQTTSTSKFYFTVQFSAPDGKSSAGVDDGSGSLSQEVGTGVHGWGMSAISGTWQLTNNGNGGGIDTGISVATNDIINVAIDDSGSFFSVFLGINGTYYNSAGSATGSTPSSASFAAAGSGTLLPMGTTDNSGSATINTAPSSIPSGYKAWDPVPILFIPDNDISGQIIAAMRPRLVPYW